MRKYVQYMTYIVKNRLKGPRKMAKHFTSTASYMQGINKLSLKFKKKKVILPCVYMVYYKM
jgi:hypothetical protein